MSTSSRARTERRGRPRLDISTELIKDAVRYRRKVAWAAEDLGCSAGYIHNRFKDLGITVDDVLAEEEGPNDN